MTREDSIRKECLMHLKAIHSNAATASVIQREAVKQGMDYALYEIKSALCYLNDAGLVTYTADAIGNVSLYRATKQGIDYYNEHLAA